MFFTNAQIDDLMAKIASLSGLDQQLADKCSPLIRAEQFDQAVTQAFVVLEERLRSTLGVRGSGRKLVQQAFDPQNGPLRKSLRLPEPEIEGLRSLFDGAFAAYRNRAAHTFVDHSPDEAVRIVYLVDLLLSVLDQARQAPKDPVLRQVYQSLPPQAAERFVSFLDHMEDIGFYKSRGKAQIPYRATLYRQATAGEEAQLQEITVFFVSGPPIPQLSIASRLLAKAVGFDVRAFEASLLSIGCRHVAAKDTPIRFMLAETNDQASFDALEGILRDLVERHGVAQR